MPLTAGIVLKDQIVLERELGRGTMGIVWLATHRGLGVHVAVKVLDTSAGLTDEMRARFDREARAIARIDSVHVVRVSDVGYGPEGQPYIVMEYLRGKDLKDRLQELGTMPVAETAIVVEQVCDALERAHAIGIVHRDLKPANIFLVAGARTFVKVLDFGVAKLDGDSTLGLTSADVLMGTPYYMSPEQFVSPRDVDHRTDLWSVAVVAYVCLTGRQPFQGETVGALALAVHNSDFPLPSSLVPALGGAVDAWFRRALQPDPAQRFASAHELAAAFMQAAASGTAGLGDTAMAATAMAITPPAVTSPHAVSLSGAAPAVTSPHAMSLSGAASALTPPSAMSLSGASPSAAFDATALASSRTTGQAALTPAPRSRRATWIVAGVVAIGCVAAAAAVGLGIRGGSSGQQTRASSQPSASAAASVPICVALAAQIGSAVPDRSAIDECDASCSSGTPGACVTLGDLLSKRPQLRDDARALSAYRRGCDARDGSACNGAGLLVGRGRGAAKSVPEEAELYKRGCDLGDRPACSSLANAYASGRGVVRDAARALGLRELGCERDSMADCNELGLLVAAGRGTARDVARAAALFKRACDGGSLAGCSNLAVAHEEGKGVARDHVTAVALARRACNGREPRGCGVLAVIAPNEQRPEDDARSLAFLTADCDALDTAACQILAEKYTLGHGVVKDEARAVSLYRAACDAGDLLACHTLGDMYYLGSGGVPQDFQRAVELLRRACEEGNQGCVDLGHAYNEGRGVRQDSSIAASYFRGACDRDEAAGCRSLGVLYEHGAGVERDFSRVASLWEKACTLGDQEGCDVLAAVLHVGRGVARNVSRAVTLMQAACDAGFMRSCTRLGAVYRSGDGVAKDSARADELSKKACAGGETDACRFAPQGQ